MDPNVLMRSIPPEITSNAHEFHPFMMYSDFSTWYVTQKQTHSISVGVGRSHDT